MEEQGLIQNQERTLGLMATITQGSVAVVIVVVLLLGTGLSIGIYLGMRGNGGEDYEYIVVGGGAAGCVVASRISRTSKVLLLEAGGPSLASTGGTDYVISTQTCPGCASSSVLRLTRFDVPYYAYTLPYLRSLFWNINHTLSAKILGGSAAVNGLIFYRGIPADFEGYPTGWSWENVLEYYKRVENVTDSEWRQSSLRGTQGPIRVSKAQTPLNWKDHIQLYIDTVLNSGMPINQDLNGASRYGLGWVQHNIANGQRVISANEYLIPALASGNLDLKLYSQVTKVLFDKKKRAIGLSPVAITPDKFLIIIQE